jgi:citrate lyase subunit beta/citryl-CoA lyase
VLRAKMEIASACHAHGKVPSHNVVTEFKDLTAVQTAAHKAARELGYTRMWSIHPDQIRPILAAFAPEDREIHTAAGIIERAAAADWAPVQFEGRLHDRASYRFYWQVLERAHQTGHAMPENVRHWFAPAHTAAAAPGAVVRH